MDNETAWQGLSKKKGDEESREPPQPGPSDFSKSFVSLLPSHVHNQGYGVSCLSLESCKDGQDFPLGERDDCPIARRWMAFGEKSRCG
jgi:hypothetical protein